MSVHIDLATQIDRESKILGAAYIWRMYRAGYLSSLPVDDSIRNPRLGTQPGRGIGQQPATQIASDIVHDSARTSSVAQSC